jgi:hypothetical protein
MVFFKAITDNFKKAEAAVIVQNLLSNAAKIGMYDGDPAKSATRLVDRLWDSNSALFSGKQGHRPHKLTIASAAFASAIELGDAELALTDSHVFALCLSQILQELHGGKHDAQMSGVDMAILKPCITLFEEFSSASNESPLSKEIDSILGGAA